MTKTMKLEIYFMGGGYINRDIMYIGESMEDIAQNINRDENNLLEYMQSQDDKGIKSFCFGGFMFQKEGIIAAQITEPDMWEQIS